MLSDLIVRLINAGKWKNVIIIFHLSNLAQENAALKEELKAAAAKSADEIAALNNKLDMAEEMEKIVNDKDE